MHPPELPLDSVLPGDCLAIAQSLPTHCLDLVYIDPPYFTNRHHTGTSRDGDGTLEFTDRWQGGRAEYLHWLAPRIEAIRRTLTPEGVFLLHLDWHVSHYAKILCDQIFGDDSLQNELVWYYQTGGASKGRFSRKHDTILFYANGPRHYFDGRAVAIPRSPKALHRAQCPTGARIKATDTHKNPDDVLTVPALNPMATERTGYPTQKPVKLLELLILALCPPTGTVGDFFCGSGTTLIAASRLGRHYFGCDSSADAIALTRRRLAAETRTLIS